MKTLRLLAPRTISTTALAAVLGLTLTACGSDDPAPAASPSTVDLAPTEESTTTTPPVASGDDDDVTDPDLRAELEEIALAEVGGGRVTDVEHSDDRDHAYEVEVDLESGEDVSVEIAEDMSVVRVDY